MIWSHLWLYSHILHEDGRVDSWSVGEAYQIRKKRLENAENLTKEITGMDQTSGWLEDAKQEFVLLHDFRYLALDYGLIVAKFYGDFTW